MIGLIKFRHKGSFKHAEKFFKKIGSGDYLLGLEAYGMLGVKALSEATPIRTGETAASWYYRIIRKKDTVIIEWDNSHVNNGVNIAVILQFGHGTGTGGFVQGIDYINPALAPVFDEIAHKAWEEVTGDA